MNRPITTLAGLTILLGPALPGCAGFGHLPEQSQTVIDGPLWDAEGAVATADGLYVALPYSGGVALLQPDNKSKPHRTVELGPGRVSGIAAAPGSDTIIAFVQRFSCKDGDGKKIETVQDCQQDDGSLEHRTEVVTIQDGKRQGAVETDGATNALAFSSDGSTAVAYLDVTDPELELDGVINLTAVVVLDLASGQATPVTVGFAAEQILFNETPEGQPLEAVVLSQNEVAIVDLTAAEPRVDTVFPLTLDPDTRITPVGVALTPDGSTAMISVAETSDLYALDLLLKSINIVELAAPPSAMAVSRASDRTVVVFAGNSSVDIIDHALFDVENLTLDEPMTGAITDGEQAILFNTEGGHDLYRLDLGDDSLVEHRLFNPATSVQVAPGGRFAVALTRAESGFNDGVEGLYDAHPGLEIVDLETGGHEPYLLEGEGLGLAFAEVADSLFTLVLQRDQDYVYQLDLLTGIAVEIELSEPPVAIGSMPDGSFFITHDATLGLVSFLDPETGKIRTIGGFAASDIFGDIDLETKGSKR